MAGAISEEKPLPSKDRRHGFSWMKRIGMDCFAVCRANPCKSTKSFQSMTRPEGSENGWLRRPEPGRNPCLIHPNPCQSMSGRSPARLRGSGSRLRAGSRGGIHPCRRARRRARSRVGPQGAATLLSPAEALQNDSQTYRNPAFPIQLQTSHLPTPRFPDPTAN